MRRKTFPKLFIAYMHSGEKILFNDHHISHASIVICLLGEAWRSGSGTLLDIWNSLMINSNEYRNWDICPGRNAREMKFHVRIACYCRHHKVEKPGYR